MVHKTKSLYATTNSHINVSLECCKTITITEIALSSLHIWYVYCVWYCTMQSLSMTKHTINTATLLQLQKS